MSGHCLCATSKGGFDTGTSKLMPIGEGTLYSRPAMICRPSKVLLQSGFGVPLLGML